MSISSAIGSYFLNCFRPTII